MNNRSCLLPFRILHRLLAVLICSLALLLCGGADAQLSEKVAKEISKATVRIVALNDEGEGGHGTGFIISQEGHVATNRHVVEEASRYFVVFSEGDHVRIRAAVMVGMSSKADLAILKCERIPGTSVAQLAIADVTVGQAVTVVGFPGAIDTTNSWATMEGVTMDGVPGDGVITSEDAKSDFQPSAFPGAVAKPSTLDGVRVIFHSAKISPGNSGGPLIDVEGRVCGINTAFIPAEKAGSDYPISIHASELVTLARAHSIPIRVSSSKASIGGVGSGLQTLLLVAIAVFAVMMFLLVLRKPRMVMVGAVSKLVGPPKSVVKSPPQRSRPAVTAPPISSSHAGGMRLRGRDLQGRSYDLPFSESDFKMGGGKLVVGRNQDISQLHLPHDSVSRQHTTLLFQGGAVHVEDRNSGNGTKVNGQHLTVGLPAIPLKPGDKLSLGEVDLIFETFN